MERIYVAEHAQKQLGFAAAVRDGNILWLSGMVSWDDSLTPLHPGDMRGQMGEIYAQLQRLLGRFGASMGDILRETVFVTDIATALENADVRRSFFHDDTLPASTWVEVRRLIVPELLIEVEVVARIGEGR